MDFKSLLSSTLTQECALALNGADSKFCNKIISETFGTSLIELPQTTEEIEMSRFEHQKLKVKASRLASRLGERDDGMNEGPAVILVGPTQSGKTLVWKVRKLKVRALYQKNT